MKGAAGMEERALLAVFFGKNTRSGALFDQIMERLQAEFPGLHVLKVGKTMINLGDSRTFFYISLPRQAARRNEALLISLGLDRPIQSPRIRDVSQPYPGRWTHHILIGGAEELDEELLSWLRQAEAFALSKRKPSRLLGK